MTKYIHTLILLFVSTFAFAQVDSTLFRSLEEDPRYVQFVNEHSKLVQREDSLLLQISDARERYIELRSEKQDVDAVEKLTTQILNMEREVLDIRTRRHVIIGGIANLEQRYIVNQVYLGGNTKGNGNTDKVNGGVEYGQLIQNSIIARSLSAGSYADLKQAQLEDDVMPRLVEEYIATHNRLGRCARSYHIATNESEGEAIYDDYLSLRAASDSLGGLIDRYWSHILNAKYYAYGYILERYDLFYLLDNSSVDFSNMQQVCANEDGEYQLDALVHYALGRPTLVAFERDVAKELGLSKAADSLQRVYDAIVQPEYRLEPITLERRSFVEYEPLVFGARDYYNDANHIPEVKVFSRGTIYRIHLGTYRNPQAPSVFKGARPLYVVKDDSGYNYYVAGYASVEEADEAVDKLASKGLKKTEVRCWQDGKLRSVNDKESDGSDADLSQTLGSRYIVLLECNAITDSMRSTIATIAPDKRVSRRGAGFAIGTFTSRSDAEGLHKVLEENYPNIKVSIIELNIQ